MDKYLKISIKDLTMPKNMPVGYDEQVIYPSEIQNIINTIGDITVEDLETAVDVLLVHFAKNNLTSMRIDVCKRDLVHVPVKEMTINDIEKELGYRIKIVKGDKND